MGVSEFRSGNGSLAQSRRQFDFLDLAKNIPFQKQKLYSFSAMLPDENQLKDFMKDYPGPFSL
jgi:hypothetical protein